MAINDNRDIISLEDVEWVVENGQYSPRIENSLPTHPQIGCVNGVAVFGANMGTLLEVEASAKRSIRGKGSLKVTGIIEEEEMSTHNRKMKRKSTAYCSVENVLTVLENIFDINCRDYHIHVNFPGGIPIDGPSAGIAIVCSVYSAIMKIPISNFLAMTGEISLQGKVKPIGGVVAKIAAAKKAGVKEFIIPRENYEDSFSEEKSINIIPIDNIKQVIEIARKGIEVIEDLPQEIGGSILTAKPLNREINL